MLPTKRACARNLTQRRRDVSRLLDYIDPLATELRASIAAEGIPITEEEFRLMAPPTLREKLQAIEEHAARDPAFRAALAEALSEKYPEGDDTLERVIREALRDAREPEVRQEAARLLIVLKTKSQNMGQQ